MHRRHLNILVGVISDPLADETIRYMRYTIMRNREMFHVKINR